MITGLLVTLITGAGGGLPIPWLGAAWRVNWILLLIDGAFWTIVSFAVKDLTPKFKDHLATTGHG